MTINYLVAVIGFFAIYSSSAREVLIIPRGVNLVFRSPSKYSTWWKTVHTKDEPVVTSLHGEARVDKDGYLRLTINSTEQGGTYKQTLRANRTEDEFPNITFHEISRTELENCAFKRKHGEVKSRNITNDNTTDLEFYIVPTERIESKSGYFDCNTTTGVPIQVLTKGTELIFIPSTTATWWRSSDRGRYVLVMDGQSDIWVDHLGRLRVRMDNEKLAGQYKLKFHTLKQGIDRTSDARPPFPKIELGGSTYSTDFDPGEVVIRNGESRELSCLICQQRNGAKNTVWYKGLKKVDVGCTFEIKGADQSQSGQYTCMDYTVGQVIEVKVEGEMKPPAVRNNGESSTLPPAWSNNEEEVPSTAGRSTEEEVPPTSGPSTEESSIYPIVAIIIIIAVLVLPMLGSIRYHHNEARLRRLGETVQNRYATMLEIWYKPVFDLKSRDGQPIYIWPCIKEKNNEKNMTLSEFLSIKRGTRVVITADAGQGKSAILNNLCRLWVSKEHLDMKRFGVLLYSSLGEIADGKLEDIFSRAGILSKSNVNTLKKNEEKILWLLDGYEKCLSEFYNSEVNDLLKGKIFPKSMVIVTAPPSCATQICSGMKSKRLLECKFSVKNKEDYVNAVKQNYDQHGGQSTSLEKLIQGAPSDLMFVPAFLAGVCSLWNDSAFNISVNSVETRTKLLNTLLKKSMKDSSGTTRNTPRQLSETLNHNPLESGIDKNTKSHLKELGKACFSALDKNEHYLHRKDLPSSINNITDIGIGDLVRINKHGQVTFSFPLMQHYFAAVFLTSSGGKIYDLVHTIEKDMPVPRISLKKACGKFWQVILFAVGLQPTSSSVDTPFLSELLKRCMHTVVYTSVDMQKRIHPVYERKLYAECSLENDREQFVRHLAKCTLKEGVSSEYFNNSHSSNFLEDLKKYDVINSWGVQLNMCEKQENGVKLTIDEFNIQGHVLGSLLDTAQIINVAEINIQKCTFNLQNMRKVDEKLSKIAMEDCELCKDTAQDGSTHQAYSPVCPFVRVLQLKRCRKFSLSVLASCFTEIEKLELEDMDDLFKNPTNSSRFCAVKKLELNTCGTVQAGIINHWFPNLVTLSIKDSELSDFQSLNFIETLHIERVKSFPPVCELYPNLNTLIINIREKDKNVSLDNLVESLTDIPAYGNDSNNSDQSQPLLPRKNLELIVLYNPGRYDAEYEWISHSYPRRGKPCTHLKSYTTCKVLSAKKKKVPTATLR